MAIEPAPSAISPPQLVPEGTQTTLAAARAERRARTRALVLALLRSPIFVIGVLILLFWVIDAILWPLFVPYDPLQQDLLHELAHPSSAHLLGLDFEGRDVLARVLAGARTVLTVAPAATALGLAGGTAIGLFTGYYRGLVDDVAMRLVDAMLAFPLIITAVFVLTSLGVTTVNVVIVIGIVFMPLVARTVRSAVLTEREREYVAAAKLLGEAGPVIMVREILPNIVGPLAVEATIRLGYAIFTSATLSFLGYGLQPPSPDWGLTIAQGETYLQIAPWIVLAPAVALATLVVAVNFVADGIRQAVDQ